MNFSQIILEPEQKELFIQIVEARRECPKGQWQDMFMIKGFSELIIPANECNDNRITNIIAGDIEELVYKGLLRVINETSSEKHFSISSEGFQYYDWLMKQQGKPVERIEKNIFQYFEFEDFKKKYSAAYKKLKQAEELLWSSDSDANFSAIGHHCREAMQEFADQLYNRVTGETSNEPKSHDKNRIKAVIEIKKTEIGTTVRPFLGVLYNYWDSISDLVQRQEHGGQKEGEPLNWEDARRVVFQTANVMFELHRTFKNA